MFWYQWMALAALGICVISCSFQFIRLIRLGKPADHAKPAGNTAKAIGYAFTGAMSPAKKESAFLHLPTYAAGLFYHMGTFLSVSLFIIILTGLLPVGWLAIALSGFLVITVCCGIGILVKRMINKELRSLSNPDDFISNILVTIFQLFTLLIISMPILSPFLTPPDSPAILQSYRPTVLQSYSPTVLPSYYLIFTLLMLYLPVGKLRHTVYFFAARYHLGYFFGRRGTWPSRQVKTNAR
jgi:nitrate reductase gamma subunit